MAKSSYLKLSNMVYEFSTIFFYLKITNLINTHYTFKNWNYKTNLLVYLLFNIPNSLPCFK